MKPLSNSEAIAAMTELLATCPENTLEATLRQVNGVPSEWRDCATGELVRKLRLYLDMTQRQLAALAGLPYSHVAQIEKGSDARLSTLRQLFAGFGCGLALLPVSRLDAEKLWRRAFEVCDGVHARRRRRYPRK